MQSFVINRKQLILGIFCLLAGVEEYLVGRGVGSTYFLHKFNGILSSFHQWPNVYGKLGSFAPEFFHPLALSLISMALVSKREIRLAICLFWFSGNFMFEFGQKYGTELAEYIPTWFGAVPILENLRNYLINGRYDVYDLIAIGLGSLTAFFIGELLAKRREGNETKYSEQENFEGRTSADY